MLARRAPACARARRRGGHELPRRARACRRRRTATRSAYIDEVCAMIPAIAREKLADAVDAFCEGIAFSPEQTARVFRAAQAAGLPVKLHADQLSNLHGARLAAEHGALSADHLEYTDEDGVAAMARAGTVAVLLPGAFYVLREKQLPPVEALRRHGVPIAIATDCNPGTSPITSLLADHEHGGDLVPAHGRGGARRRHPRGGARARPARRRSARSSPASGATSRSGTSSGRPSSSTGSASIRCMRGCGAADDRRDHADAGTRDARATGARSRTAPACGSTPRRCRRSRRGRGRSMPSSRAASRSTGSIPASASSPACTSRPKISPRSSATSCSRTRPGSASRCGRPMCG